MSITKKENHVDTDALRAELKVWENAFKQKHGRKAGREDIKKDATIQSKYKLFQTLTAKTKPPPQPTATPQKRTRPDIAKHPRVEKPSTAPKATPTKIPSKQRTADVLQPTLSPAQELEPTPAFIRNALGPTPQRDGQVLGLFDIIEDSPLKSGSPSKTTGTPFIAGTPSKPTTAAPGSESADSRTPQSLSKRYYLDAFVGTPAKRKREDDDVGTTSTSKRMFATPSFLRRSAPLAPIAEDQTEATSTTTSFFGKKRGLRRSLSSIIRGLKKQEEERMDDEWDIMNQIEEEEEGEDGDGDEQKKTTKEVPKELVEESQAVEMPLGPDQAPESSEEDSGPEDGQTTRKPWKKKGLKRQTRRVLMRPVMHKAKKADEVDGEESSDDEGDKVAETQMQGAGAGPEEGDEYGSDPEVDDDTAQPKKSKKKPAAKAKTIAKEKNKDDSKKKPRKVDPNAHANFRKLNIKNKNSKANGRGRKFGRR